MSTDAQLHNCRGAEPKAGQVNEAASKNARGCLPRGSSGVVAGEAGSTCIASTACEAGPMAAGVDTDLPHHPMEPPAPCQSHEAASGHSSGGSVAGSRGGEVSPEDIADLLRRYAGTCGATGSRLRGGGRAVIDVATSTSMAGSSDDEDGDAGHRPDTPPATQSRFPPRRQSPSPSVPTRRPQEGRGCADGKHRRNGHAG